MQFNSTWVEFLPKIEELISEGKSLRDINLREKKEIERYFEKYKLWHQDIISLLENAFGKRNKFSIDFGLPLRPKYNFNVGRDTSKQEVSLKEIKDSLREKLYKFNYYKNVFSVSDLITNPSSVDLEQRSKYTTEEVLNFILEKLYLIYDNNMYAIHPILIGNGIEIKRDREEFEYVKVLENKGYIETNGVGHIADARLSINGKMYIEEKRKFVKPNYDNIDKDWKVINEKMNDIIEKLEEIGMGQEIIFDEFDKLRTAHTKLDQTDWGQLFKAKLIDMFLSKIISFDNMKYIYEYISNEALKLP